VKCTNPGAVLLETIERQALMSSEGVLALHNTHRSFSSFAEFQPELPGLLQHGGLIEDCVELTSALGLLEPLTGEHIPPDDILIQGPNWRESLMGNGLLSRNRGMLWLLEHIYGSLDALKKQDIYLVEALSSFAQWLQRQLGDERIICSEFSHDTELAEKSHIPHQDLCALTFGSESFDLVLCNELFEHVQYLDRALSEIARVLRPGGRLVATCPLAIGQVDSIVKAVEDPETGEITLLGEREFHGDPIRPTQSSLVYRIPGWDILEQMKEAGFSQTHVHHIASWKYGVVGSDLPDVLVIEAKRQEAAKAISQQKNSI